MVGLIVTLAVSIGAIGLGEFLLKRWVADLDLAARLGLGGLVGLGTLGLITLPIGLIPGGLKWGLWPILLLAAFGAYEAYKAYGKSLTKPALPQGAEVLLPLVIGVAVLFAAIGVLAPSDTYDWDTLAYHLAVPKLWLAQGQIHYISYIHHSNFPWTIDDLYIWGLQWGGQQGAKAFSLAYFGLGLLAIFGLARMRYGQRAAWWATLSFATIPVVMTVAGSAYIDVSNGLYAGLAIVFAAWAIENRDEPKWVWLGAICLGFAAASKFTGLQTIFACCAMLAVFGLRSAPAKTAKQVSLTAIIALAIACPWYIKNVVYTGNPVFPFFYSVFKGKNWDSFNARIYTEEQKSFGVGTTPSLDVTQVGHAVLGLAYQPGRYINPAPSQGQGFPFGALGFVGLAGGLFWCFSGRGRKFELATLATVGISLLLWFALSQQARYIIAQMVPLSILAGGAVVRLKTGQLLAGAAALQAAFSLYLVNDQLTTARLQVLLGKVSPEEYQTARIAFYEPSQAINKLGGDGRVALYDEVFGYLLDVPYIWANPGHSTELGYDAMRDGKDLVASYKRNGITRVYLSFSIYSGSDPGFQRFLAALGLAGSKAAPYEGKEREAQFSDLRNKWKALVADAVESGDLVPVQAFQHGRRPIGVLYSVK